jgi:hypothetical protein
MLKKLGKFLYEKDIEEIRSIVEYLHFKVVSVVSVIPWFIIILDKRNSVFYPINSKENFWNSIMLLTFLLFINMILYIIAGHFILEHIKKIKMHPEKESETSWKKIWKNNQDIDVELVLKNLSFDNDDYFSVQIGQVFNGYLSNSFTKRLREVIYSNINYYNIWVKEMTLFKAGQKKTFSYKHNEKEIKNLLIHLDIEIPDYIKKENLSSDDFWENCKDLLSFEIVSLELGKTTLEPNILGYVSKYDYYELRGVLKVSLKDDKAKETLLTLQEQFKGQNQTLLELTEFEQNIKG